MTNDYQHPHISFEVWKKRVSPELWDAYSDAYGAVMFGVHWNGADVDELSKDDALEYAAAFLKKLSGWINEEVP